MKEIKIALKQFIISIIGIFSASIFFGIILSILKLTSILNISWSTLFLEILSISMLVTICLMAVIIMLAYFCNLFTPTKFK